MESVLLAERRMSMDPGKCRGADGVRVRRGDQTGVEQGYNRGRGHIDRADDMTRRFIDLVRWGE